MEKKIRTNWRELAIACTESGLTVFGWCKENKIPYSTCRQWLKRLRDESGGVESGPRELSVWGKVEINQSDASPPAPYLQSFPAGIRLSYGLWGVQVNRDFDPELLSRVMKVVEGRC